MRTFSSEHNTVSMLQVRAHCRTCIAANTMAPPIEQRKKLYCEVDCKKIGGKAQIWLPSPVFGVAFEGLEKDGLVSGSTGPAWEGFSTRLPWTADRWLLKRSDGGSLIEPGALVLCVGGGVEPLVPGVIEGQVSLFCTCFGCMTYVLFCCPGETTQNLYWSRIQPVWAGSTVTIIPKKINNYFKNVPSI